MSGMRPSLLPGELVVDIFAGGGGASTGIEAAIGRPVDIAIDHNAAAVAMHKQNHPETKHYQEDVWAVDPREACGIRPVGLLWASPACTHYSRARGTANPLSAKIRSLAWVVVRWAKTVRPRLIFLENVEEFVSWGPLRSDGRADELRTGRTFRQWVGRLAGLGYNIEFRTLPAADYGAPTSRSRLFMIARCDGQPIVWPGASHGPRRLSPHRAAAEIIDWSLPCHSIFAREKPLAEATLKRIAAGLQRYVIGARNPGPFIVRRGHYSTITGAGLIEGRGAGVFRGQPLASPLGTVCATNDKHLVAPVIVKHYGGVVGHRVDDRSLGTVTAKDHHSLAAAFLMKFYGTSTGAPMQLPLPTVTSGGGHGGGHLAAVRAFLVNYYRSEGLAQTAQVDLPLGTVTTHDRFGLVALAGEPFQIVDIGLRMLQPHELFAAQGFPERFEIHECAGRRLTKTEQTRLAGNSVCPPIAHALVAANTRGDASRGVAA